MKILRDACHFTTVLFNCPHCDAVWAAEQMPKCKYSADYHKLNEREAQGERFWWLSKTGKTFFCKCPYCNTATRTPRKLHEFYLKFHDDLTEPAQ